MEDRWVARPGSRTLRREHPRAGLHPRPGPAELRKSSWKNSFARRGHRGQRHQVDWRVLLHASSIIPATTIARTVKPSAEKVYSSAVSVLFPIWMTCSSTSKRRTESVRIKIGKSTTTLEVCFQPFSASGCLKRKNHQASQRTEAANPA